MKDCDRKRLVDELWNEIESIVARRVFATMLYEEGDERTKAISMTIAAALFALTGHARCIENLFEELGLEDTVADIMIAAKMQADEAFDSTAPLGFPMPGADA